MAGIPEATDDVSLNFGEEDDLRSSKVVRHPVAVFFHMFFRITAILAYLLCGWFSDSFIVSFVLIVILLSMDFWTVKNISGRLLVGLRWWNYVDDDGNSHWVYESRKGSAAKNLVTNTESRIFWLSIIICQIFWVVFFFASLFSLHFKWLMVAILGNILNGANAHGYIRCKLGAKKKLSSVATSFLGQQVFKSMMSSATTATAASS